MKYNEKTRNKLVKKERKLLKKLDTFLIYKLIKKVSKNFFSPIKIFISLGENNFKKIIGIISITTFYFLGKKIGYIDDFIINKKLRGKGFGNKIMTNLFSKSEKENYNYLALISANKRKASHFLYKKLGFTLISTGLFIFAYKKIKKKK